MPQSVKRVWNIVTTVFVILIVVMAILLVGVRLVGIKPYTVLSGSMEPKYPVGSMIYVKEVDPLTLRTGDPVTFMLNETTVATHRIIEVIPDENDPTVVRFRTQGDNNDIPDGDTVHSANVIGKPIFSIPYLGYLANYVQNPPGRYVALGVCFLLLLAVILPGSGEKKKKDAQEDEPAPDGAGESPDAKEGDAPQGSQINDPKTNSEEKEDN